jgi:hypothetical protein
VDDGQYHRNTITIAEHCAKPSEIQACFSAFRRMRKRATGLTAIKFADFKLDEFVISATEFNVDIDYPFTRPHGFIGSYALPILTLSLWDP